MQNRGSWARLGVLMLQGLAVLTSILLAFAIDAGWDNHSDRAAEREILESLRTEVLENQRIVEERVVFMRAIESSSLALLRIANQGLGDISADSVDHLLADVTWWGEASWQTSATDAVISSGDLSLLEHRRLRTLVSGWAQSLERVAVQESQQIATARELWLPFLMRVGDLTTIGRAQVVVPGGGDYKDVALSLPEGAVFDHRVVTRGREFRNVVVARYWSLTDVLWAYSVAAASLEELLDALEQELRK